MRILVDEETSESIDTIDFDGEEIVRSGKSTTILGSNCKGARPPEGAKVLVSCTFGVSLYKTTDEYLRHPVSRIFMLNGDNRCIANHRINIDRECPVEYDRACFHSVYSTYDKNYLITGFLPGDTLDKFLVKPENHFLIEKVTILQIKMSICIHFCSKLKYQI